MVDVPLKYQFSETTRNVYYHQMESRNIGCLLGFPPGIRKWWNSVAQLCIEMIPKALMVRKWVDSDLINGIFFECKMGVNRISNQTYHDIPHSHKPAWAHMELQQCISWGTVLGIISVCLIMDHPHSWWLSSCFHIFLVNIQFSQLHSWFYHKHCHCL